MKRLILSLIFSLVCLSSFAEYKDIIISTTQQIPCKVLEVKEGIVHYVVEWDMDRIQRIETSTLRMIVYEDGTVVRFNEIPQPTAATQQTPQTTTQPVQQQQVSYEQQSTIQQPTSPANTNAQPTLQDDIVWDKEHAYFIINDKIMKEEQYLSYVRKNCQEAYDAYYKYLKKRKAGVGLLSAGASLIGVGGLLMAVSPAGFDYTPNYKDNYKGEALLISGGTIMAPGLVMMCAGIPLYCKGKDYQQKSIDAYNHEKRYAKYYYSFNIQATQNGIGLALHF